MTVESDSEGNSGSSWNIGYNRQAVEFYVEKGGMEAPVGVFRKEAFLGTTRTLGEVSGEEVGV